MPIGRAGAAAVVYLALLICLVTTLFLVIPILVQQVASILREAKGEGRTVLLVEQNLRFATAVADRHYLLSHGTIVATLGNDDVRARESELRHHLGI